MTIKEVALTFKFIFLNYGNSVWPEALGFCTENSQMFGQGPRMEFLVCEQTLAPDKTRMCGRVPEAMLFNDCHLERLSFVSAELAWHLTALDTRRGNT